MARGGRARTLRLSRPDIVSILVTSAKSAQPKTTRMVVIHRHLMQVMASSADRRDEEPIGPVCTLPELDLEVKLKKPPAFLLFAAMLDWCGRRLVSIAPELPCMHPTLMIGGERSPCPPRLGPRMAKSQPGRGKATMEGSRIAAVISDGQTAYSVASHGPSSRVHWP